MDGACVCSGLGGGAVGLAAVARRRRRSGFGDGSDTGSGGYAQVIGGAMCVRGRDRRGR
jgi:hypothetical protein